MRGYTQLTELFSEQDPFVLENGSKLNRVSVAFQTHGNLNSAGDNTVLVCHALTGDAHVAGEAVYSEELLRTAPGLNAMKASQAGWWDGLIGAGRTIDTDRYFVICANILGSCYGTTGPSSIDASTGAPFLTNFPQISVRDIVRVQHELLKELSVNILKTVIGGSLGGMQVLEWAVMYPQMVHSIIPVATASRHSDWCIALNHLARSAITNDSNWDGGNYKEQPQKGLSLARQIAMVSYRSDLIFNQRFARHRIEDNSNETITGNHFQAESYLSYQGKKLVNRFDANSYLYLSRAMDEHDISRSRGTMEHVLGSIEMPVLCIGIDSDILYPAHEQRAIAAALPQSQYMEINSMYGHDAFLVEFDQLNRIITPFLDKNGR